MTPLNLRQKVLYGLRWSAGARFLGQLVTWAITIVVIRLVSPADYGLMDLSSVFVLFIAMLNELGLGAAVVQRKDLDDNTLRPLFGFVLLASVAFYLSLAGAAPLIAGFYEEPRLVLLIRVLALQFLLMGFTVLPRSLLLREMAFRKIAVVDFCSAIVGSITTLALAFKGQGVWALVWGSLMFRVVAMIGLNLAQPFLRLPRFKMKGIRAMFFFGGYVTLIRMLWYFYTRADALIIGKVLGNELLGLYAVASYLASLPMEKTSGIINQVAFPAFSSVQSDLTMVSRHFLKSVRMLSFLAFPMLWGISIIAPELVVAFLGEKWSQATLPLQLISLIIPVRMISNLMNPPLLALGRADVSLLNTTLASIVMPISYLVGCSWGLAGVSLAWVIVFPVVFTLNLFRVVKILEIGVLDVFSAMAKPIAGGLVMYGCLLGLKNGLFWHFQSVSKMVVIILCGILVYGGMILLTNRTGLKEIGDLARGRSAESLEN